ncbi:MAG: protein-methionine-sulfoxide reductase catalytic subunit MsrP [Pseudomonadota bacterium]
MLIRRPTSIKPSEITSESAYLSRREIVTALAGAALIPAAGRAATLPRSGMLDDVQSSELSTDETPNTFEEVTSYNNFYELGLGKSDPAKNADQLKPRPWSFEVSGEADITGQFNLEDFVKPFTLEDRIYRFRCVEAWSMVIPWVGIPLADIVKFFRPNSKAKYVAFETIYDTDMLPAQRSRVLDWPYREGLTIEEATHPLTIMAVGVYGRVLPNQNGAPMRLIVPWKYGFKSIKSIVGIRFTEQQPATSWNLANAREYGFYANVNPEVDHPRWSQARERRIGAGFFAPKQETLMFNGYADQVADLYSGLDLRRNF